MKNVVIISDLHCGSVVGLTPPRFEPATEVDGYVEERIALWENYTRMIDDFKEEHGSIHVLIVNGDCIDGKCSRWGATDLITARIRTQIDMAAECLNYVKADKILMTYGTPYHVGAEEDWEATLAREVDATIKDHLFVNVEGVQFSIKHKVAGSQIPHGRHTAVAREKLWDIIWSVEKKQHPLSDVIVRSHVHYFAYCGNDTYLGMTTPALQGLGSKFGARMCAGTVDFGLVYFKCRRGKFTWGWDIVTVEEQQDSVISV